MSHFTVLVQITKEQLAEQNGDLNAALSTALAPYQENNMGDCPENYLTFTDCTAEVQENAREVIEADGYMGKTFPDHIGKTLLDVYDNDMDKLAYDYSGYKKHGDQYGYWENVNAKWDWWQLGGRWAGMLRIKPDIVPTLVLDTTTGKYKKRDMAGVRGEPSLLFDVFNYKELECDAAKIKDIDFDFFERQIDEKAEIFWKQYQRYLELKSGVEAVDKDDRFLKFDMEYQLANFGLSKVIKPREPMLDVTGLAVKDGEGNTLFIGPQIEYQEFDLNYLKTNCRWCWEFGTFAVLDAKGNWHEKGSMGWFGMSSDTNEDRAAWAKSYSERFVYDENPETILAVVDCHI